MHGHANRVRASAAPPRFGAVPLDLLEDIRRESDRFHAVLSSCDPGARVPACPEWDAADLLWHLTDVQWFWTRVITTRPAAPPEDLEHPARPESYDELLSGFAAQSAALVEALAEAGPDAEAWHWSAVQTAGTSYRRQAHEALIHRLDAEQTAGQVTPLDPALAADGVLEALDVMYGGEHPDFVGAGAHVAIGLTDTGDTIVLEPGRIEAGRHTGPHLVVRSASAPALATVTGTAADVDAWLWHRVPDSAVTFSGSPELLEAFRAAVSPPLD